MTRKSFGMSPDRRNNLRNQACKIYRCDLAKQWTNVFTTSFHYLSVIRLPLQVVPLPANPLLHVQLYEPTKFSHVAFVSQGLEIHSLMSKKN